MIDVGLTLLVFEQREKSGRSKHIAALTEKDRLNYIFSGGR
jgi:hypothetical protein